MLPVKPYQSMIVICYAAPYIYHFHFHCATTHRTVLFIQCGHRLMECGVRYSPLLTMQLMESILCAILRASWKLRGVIVLYC